MILSNKIPVKNIFSPVYLFKKKGINEMENSQPILAKPANSDASYTEKLKGELTDPRYLQITYLACFLCYGIYQLYWEISAVRFLATLMAALGVQFIGARRVNKPLSSIKSALITVLGITILLRSDETWVFVLAAIIAIGTKFIIRFNGKHIFNPANVGIIAAILITGQAWVSPGQWGNAAALLFMVGAAGLMVVFKVGRFDLALPFLFTFAGLEFYRIVLYQGWPVDFFFHKLLNGALLLFTFFMITDPVSTPGHRTGRILFAVLVAVLAFYLSNFKFVQAGPVWALFFLSPLTIVFDKVLKGKRFNWASTYTPIQTKNTSL